MSTDLLDCQHKNTWQRLLDLAKGGDANALGELLQSWRAYLLTIANAELAEVLHPKGGASDLVQEAYLQAEKSLANFRGQTEEEWRGWLRSILRHRLDNFDRRYRCTEERQVEREVYVEEIGPNADCILKLTADDETPSQQAMYHEKVEALRRALAALPEDRREIIRLRYYEGLSFAKIAERLGQPEKTVWNHWSEALEQLGSRMRGHQ